MNLGYILLAIFWLNAGIRNGFGKAFPLGFRIQNVILSFLLMCEGGFAMNWMAKTIFWYDSMSKSVQVNVGFLSPKIVFCYYIIYAIINMYCSVLGLKMIGLKKNGFVFIRTFIPALWVLKIFLYYLSCGEFGNYSKPVFVLASGFWTIVSLWLFFFSTGTIRKELLKL